MITNHARESLIAFERRIQSQWESGELPSLLHLSGGNEDDLLRIFADIRPQDWIFISHRGHYHALLKGMPEDRLEMLIRSDRSMFIFDRDLRIYQSAILGGCCGIAVGVAKAIQEKANIEPPTLPEIPAWHTHDNIGSHSWYDCPWCCAKWIGKYAAEGIEEQFIPAENKILKWQTEGFYDGMGPIDCSPLRNALAWYREYGIERSARVYCFLGDGASDNGHLYEAALYATGHDLPVTFIVENNNKQVDTDIPTRRGLDHWKFEMYSPKIQEYNYTPTFPHAGSGCAHQITFQRTHPL